jgi:hypothetical protein
VRSSEAGIHTTKLLTLSGTENYYFGASANIETSQTEYNPTVRVCTNQSVAEKAKVNRQTDKCSWCAVTFLCCFAICTTINVQLQV